MKSRKKLILIVDDNPENRKVLGTLLVKEGYEVGAAPDGQKALDFVRRVEPDLILLDVMMPGMSGFEVCEKLKADMGTKHIPIIFLTAKTDPDDIVKGFRVGGVDYVAKPFHSEELLARVNTHIEVNMLRGMLPMCASCKSIRNDDGFWQSVEEYIHKNSQATLSHSICPDCMEKLYGNQEWYQNLKKQEERG